MRNKTALLLFISVMVVACYTYYAIGDCVRNQDRCFDRILSVGQLAPERYRVLQPAIEKTFAPDGAVDHVLLVDIAVTGLLILILVPSLYIWLKRWTNDDRAMLGVFIFAVVLIAAYHFWFRSLGITLESAFVALMLATLGNQRRGILIGSVLILVGSLNRETTILLPIIYAAYYADEWRAVRYWKVTSYYLLLWGIVTAALHIVLGYAPHVFGNVITGTLAHNLEYLPDAIATNILLLPLAYMVITGYKRAPALLKRLAVVASIYAVAVIGAGGWGESLRLCLPALVLLIPLALNPKEAVNLTASLNPHSN